MGFVDVFLGVLARKRVAEDPSDDERMNERIPDKNHPSPRSRKKSS